MSVDPAELQKLLEERDKSRASRRREWEIQDVCGIEPPPPAQKTIDLEGLVVKEGVKKALRDGRRPY